jgi:hypothetical protein
MYAASRTHWLLNAGSSLPYRKITSSYEIVMSFFSLKQFKTPDIKAINAQVYSSTLENVEHEFKKTIQSRTYKRTKRAIHRWIFGNDRGE